MGIDSVDIANATANDAQRSVADQAVLIDWLIARVQYLEDFLVIDERIRPELPSERRRRLYRESIEQSWLGCNPPC